MEFKRINLLPENWLHALGATLFHSLWQGIVLALLCAVVMFATRRTSARIRYNFLTTALLLFVVAIAFTFYIEFKPQQVFASYTKPVNEVKINLLSATDGYSATQSAKHSLLTGLNQFSSIWNTYTFQIVLMWFLVICVKGIQLAVGLNGVFFLRNNQTYAAGKIWDEHLKKLTVKLAISQQVTLLQSGIAKVPLVVGHLKPIILIPLGLLNGLSSAEVEAILSHELAHIKRRDYLVNLLQSFIEIVFFFNPAVLWVSQLIKNEREHCCDDLAIACVNDRKNYVKALIFCQEFKQGAPAYAMGITGKNGSLLQRVSRMLLNTNSTLNKMEKTILTIALVSMVICSAAFKSVAYTNITTTKSVTTSSFVQQDTLKKAATTKKPSDKKTIGTGEKSFGETEIRQDSAEAKRIENEAKKSVYDGSPQHEETADRIKLAIADARRAALDRQLKEEDKKRAEADKKAAEEDRKATEQDRRVAEQDRRIAAQDKKIAEQNRKWAQENGNNLPQAPNPPKPARVARTPLPPTPPTPPAAIKDIAPAAPPAPPVPGRSVTKTNTERVVTSKSVTDGDGKDYTNAINKELMADRIISNTNNLSYKLNKNELIVNGVKQSPAVQKKYKDKYLKSESHSLMYNYLVEKSSGN
ncbi:M56 family metallopeptidase [Pedobacter sp. AW1-32]|uniref:M56 family metallopeptidase n=1 Tax=Pedobacter sp. AW1-32 TaxID=3383026 RepID=UPI003FF103E1